jgi:hypothetical protein
VVARAERAVRVLELVAAKASSNSVPTRGSINSSTLKKKKKKKREKKREGEERYLQVRQKKTDTWQN